MSLRERIGSIFKGASEPKPLVQPAPKEYIDEMKEFVKEHMHDKGFPPKSNILADATVDALNKK